MQVQVRGLLEGCVPETEVRQGKEKSSSSLNKEVLNLHIASGKGKRWEGPGAELSFGIRGL